MKDKTLLIMAAGMGSRFGGLKQIEPMGPNNEFLIDYSIYDAVQEGFNKVVFIIKEENFKVFKETIGSRVEKHVRTEYVFQDINNVPENTKIPESRIKPWGTSHAILCAKDIVKEPFAIINADDFYGRDGYKVLSHFLDNANNNEICVIGYHVNNTLSEHGAVKRAVCKTKEGILENLIESSIIKENNIITASPLNGDTEMTLKENDLVAVNLFGCTPILFDYLEKESKIFFETADLEKDEFLIPETIKKSQEEQITTIKVLQTEAKWYGITYQEDKQAVKDELKKMVENNNYPQNLWK